MMYMNVVTPGIKEIDFHRKNVEAKRFGFPEGRHFIDFSALVVPTLELG
jgi:hypothetical protein